MSIDNDMSPLEQVRRTKFLKELQQSVATTLTHAGLAIFPTQEEGEDPGGAVVNVDARRHGVAVGWFTSDALIDQDPGEGFVQACEAAMVNAMATILVSAGMSVSLCPWEFDGDRGGISLFIGLNRDS
ncbi:hypothetical protein ABZ249_31460 [Nocardiopsis sp. NPDC006139]|uniref:hypothetical protein n=1 Tax=Nocardiopsis sp. NPDC006139 TaxID=3154578 RepID=UPI0033BE4C4D